MCFVAVAGMVGAAGTAKRGDDRRLRRQASSIAMGRWYGEGAPEKELRER